MAQWQCTCLACEMRPLLQPSVSQESTKSSKGQTNKIHFNHIFEPSLLLFQYVINMKYFTLLVLTKFSNPTVQFAHGSQFQPFTLQVFINPVWLLGFPTQKPDQESPVVISVATGSPLNIQVFLHFDLMFFNSIVQQQMHVSLAPV